MNLRILHCADIHLGHVPNGIEERENDYFISLRHLVDAAIEKKADVFLIAGDLFHHRSPDARTLQRAQEQFARLKTAGIQTVAVEGNHDKALYTAKQSWLAYLDWAGGIKLLRPEFSEQTPFLSPYSDGHGCVLTIGGVRFVGLGFLGATTRARVRSLLDTLEPFSGFTIAILHTGVDRLRGLDMGAILGSDLEPYRGVVDYVALGHVHGRYENGFYFNPGAPEVVNIRETRLGEKGYYWIETRGKEFSAQFIPTDHRKVWYFDFSSGTDTQDVITKCAEVNQKDMVFIRLFGKSETLVDADAVKQAVEAAYHPVYCEVHDLSDDPFSEEAEGLSHTMQLEREVFAAMAEEHGLNKTAGDRILNFCSALLDDTEPDALYALLENGLEERV